MKRYRVTRRYIAEEIVEIDAAGKEEAVLLSWIATAGGSVPGETAEQVGSPRIVTDGTVVHNYVPKVEVVR